MDKSVYAQVVFQAAVQDPVPNNIGVEQLADTLIDNIGSDKSLDRYSRSRVKVKVGWRRDASYHETPRAFSSSPARAKRREDTSALHRLRGPRRRSTNHSSRTLPSSHHDYRLSIRSDITSRPNHDSIAFSRNNFDHDPQSRARSDLRDPSSAAPSAATTPTRRLLHTRPAAPCWEDRRLVTTSPYSMS